MRGIVDREVLAVYVPTAQRTVHVGLRVPNPLYVRTGGDASSVAAAVPSPRSSRPSGSMASSPSLRRSATRDRGTRRPGRAGA
jgi:hypothetical protein